MIAVRRIFDRAWSVLEQEREQEREREREREIEERDGILRQLDMTKVPKAIEHKHFCPVCIRGAEDEGVPIFLLMPCGHTMCKDCYERIRSLQCGECRGAFEEKDLRAL
jgi:molybdenum cofactor biosynthesis enzyme MoaA